MIILRAKNEKRRKGCDNFICEKDKQIEGRETFQDVEIYLKMG